MTSNYKRINVLIRPEQHEWVNEEGLSLSGLVRDLLDDWFGETKITLTVSAKTKKLYDRIVSNFGAHDSEIEPYLLEVLDKLLEEKKRQIEELRTRISEDRKR